MKDQKNVPLTEEALDGLDYMDRAMAWKRECQRLYAELKAEREATAYSHAQRLAAANTAQDNLNRARAAEREVERLTRQLDRFREALTWSVGFIRCNLPKTSAHYEDMRNAEELVLDDPLMAGEFQIASMRAGYAEERADHFRERCEALDIAQAEAEHTIDALRTALAATEDHAAGLQRFIADPEKVVLEREQDGSVTVAIKHLAVRAFVASLANTIGDAPNFVTMDFELAAGPFFVTVRRRNGKSPSQVLGELREEIDRQKEQLERAERDLAAAIHAMAHADLSPRELIGTPLACDAEKLALGQERDRLRAQLPEGMQHCTIVFKQCERGHGWLTATNWAQHGCPTCERDRLQAAVAEHHGQRGEDRCWLDDDKLYAAAGLPPVDRRVGDQLAMLANCARFIACRTEGGHWPTYRELEVERDRLKAEKGGLSKVYELTKLDRDFAEKELARVLAAFRSRIGEERRYKHWDGQSGDYTFGKVLKWLDEALAGKPEIPPA